MEHFGQVIGILERVYNSNFEEVPARSMVSFLDKYYHDMLHGILEMGNGQKARLRDQ